MPNRPTITGILRLLFLCSLVLMTLAPNARAADEVAVYVTAIMAAHESNYVDPELAFIADEVKTLFTYSSFKKLGKYTVLLSVGQRDRIMLPRDRDLVVHFTSFTEEGKIDLYISMGNELDTHVVLMDGGHMLIGGPEYGDGTLILLIEAMV